MTWTRFRLTPPPDSPPRAVRAPRERLFVDARYSGGGSPRRTAVTSAARGRSAFARRRARARRPRPRDLRARRPRRCLRLLGELQHRHDRSRQLDGSGVDQSFITGASGPVGLTVDGSHVYWANFNINRIGRANVDGSGADQSFIQARAPSGSRGRRRAHLLDESVPGRDRSRRPRWVGRRPELHRRGPWSRRRGGRRRPRLLTNLDESANTNTIGRANLDGTGVDNDFITGISGPVAPVAIAVDGAHIYWTATGRDRIGRANLDGTGVDQSFITGASGPLEVAVDAAHLYWTNNATGTIGRANLDGTGVDQSLIPAPVGRAGSRSTA